MTWRPVDCHAHSQHSDGALTVTEVLERAASLGVRPSVTDHISRDAPTTVDSPRAVAEYLDQQIKKILHGGVVVETHKAAILAALQVTSELFKARDARDAMDADLKALGDEVRRWLPPAKRGEGVKE